MEDWEREGGLQSTTHGSVQILQRGLGLIPLESVPLKRTLQITEVYAYTDFIRIEKPWGSSGRYKPVASRIFCNGLVDF